jgi:hypothetical protein
MNKNVKFVADADMKKNSGGFRAYESGRARERGAWDLER